MTNLEKLYSIIENSRDVGVKLNTDVLRQVEELGLYDFQLSLYNWRRFATTFITWKKTNGVI